MKKHGDPGPVPSALNAGGLADDAADKMLADMLALQSPELAEQAIAVGNWTAFERQSKNPLYYKRVAKVRRVSLAEAAAHFRRHVWWFVHASPKTRARAQKQEK
jgi:hypothetical protein